MGHRVQFILVRSALILSAYVAALAVIVEPTNAEAKQMVLNCEIEKAAGDMVIERGAKIDILIDEERAILIYGIGRTDHARMNIAKSHPNLIVANGDRETIVITKHDSKFVYTAVVLVSENENFSAFGTTQRGRCFKNPFH